MYPREMVPATRAFFDYLCVICDKQNTAIAPMSEVMERTGIAQASINRAKAQLFQLDFMRQRSSTVFMLNPNKVFKDDADKRQDICEVYDALVRKQENEK